MSTAEGQNQTSGGSNNDQGQGQGGVAGGQQQSQHVTQQQQQQQQQQQLQLQQNASAQNSQANQQQQQMQQLQVIQQPIQNPTYVYNAQGQPQLIMPSNIAFNQLNPQIQVITAAGKTFQQNQLSSPHMLSSGYATIPTSAANNQAYITIGQLINSSQQPILQQHGQQNKPGDMQKVIQPNQITQAQLPQGITWAPQFQLQNLQNPIYIQRGQGDQQPMFIQQQPLHNNSGSHQQFAMPTSNGLQISQQQNPQTSVQSTQSVAMSVQQNQSQPTNGSVNVMSMTAMKAPGQANLQPKPQPLQIQPSPTNQTNQQQQQQQQQAQAQAVAAHHQQQLQNVNVTMGGVSVGGQQFQMLQQNQILTQNAQGQITTTQVIPQQGLTGGGQGQGQVQQRHLTILPQQGGGQQQVTFIQQHAPPQQQQQQQIRPNYTVTAASPTTQQQQQLQQQQVGGPPTTSTAPQQRPKIRKPGVGRGGGGNNANQQNNQSPNQGNKVMYPRPNMPNSAVAQQQQQIQAKMVNNTGGSTLSRISVANNNTTNLQQQQQQQPLKTINMSALHTPPTLPDATLTPLIPQNNSQITATLINNPPAQAIQLFASSPVTQMPTPHISITPAPILIQQQQQKKDDNNQSGCGITGETEKENTKMKQSSQVQQHSSSHHEDGDESKQNKLPKAMVKPQAQILTHVIEGFVIQEASEPFPPVHKNGDCDEPPKKKLALANLGGGEMGKCEMCGKHDFKSKFKKNKRFCSSACAKGMKAHAGPNPTGQQVNNTSKNRNNNKKWTTESGDDNLTDETSSSMGDARSCSSPAVLDEQQQLQQQLPDPKMNPVKWNVAEVVDFVRSLPGCSEYADDFAVQEIDGQALMLLKEDHLMSAIGMKLGPALKICAKIEALRIANSGVAAAVGGSEQKA